MAFATVAARLSKKEQRELEQVMDVEGFDKSGALRSMFERGVSEWKRERALSLLRRGKVSIGKASEIAGVSLLEMIELVRFHKIPFIHIREGEIEEELTNLEHAGGAG